MTLYLYNCNYLNEFLEEIETEHPEQWDGCSTEVPPAQCNIVGKSYAWNPESRQWDKLIEDWRGITLYNKQDSRIIKQGETGPKPGTFIEIVPPDNEKKYIWNGEEGNW